MTRLNYLANIRLPTEKAHGYQIMQMCEAFAEAGAEVVLVHANRRNSPELEGIQDVWACYDVTQNFTRETVPCLDLYPALRGLPPTLSGILERLVAWLQVVTYTLALVLRLRPTDADVFYSRDSVPLVVLAALRPGLRGRLFYEAHDFPATRVGYRLRRWLVRRVEGVIVITRHLAKRYWEQFLLPDRRLLVAPDGVRLERFADLGDRAACRETLGLPQDTFIVGYVGQLHLRGMGKGVDTLVEAVALLTRDFGSRPVRLCIVGGPDDMVGDLYNLAARHQLPGEYLITPGQVRPHEVPLWMRAFDVCVLPSPRTTFFAYYTSPLKLFEYMASGTPIVASNLPAFGEIVDDGRSALFVPPSAPAGLSRALRHLQEDPELGKRLSQQARQDVARYTWQERARSILAFTGERSR